MKRLGDGELAHGTRNEGTSQGILHQPRRAKRLDVLCQGEMDPFWEKGHLPTLGAQTSWEVQRVRTALKKPMLLKDSPRVDKWSGAVAKDQDHL